MLTPYDDYLIHQTVDTLDHAATGDPRFQDRGLFNVHSKSGEFLIQLGFGVYPNQNMIDGWICGIHADQQHNLRAARPLDHDRSDLNIGPIKIEVLKPMSEWRIKVDDTEHGIQCDLTFHSRTPAYEFRPVFIRRNNSVDHHQIHVMQSGTYSGWVRIGDYVTEGEFSGSRDRSWGMRGPQANEVIDMKTHLPVTDSNASTEPAPQGRTSRAWIAAEFDKYALHGWFWTDGSGNALIADGAVIEVADGTTRSTFNRWSLPEVIQDSRGLPESLDMTLFDERGVGTSLHARPLISRCPDGNGYFKGFYGRKRSNLHVEGENWDMSQPAFRKEFGYMNGPMLAEFRYGEDVGYGILITALLTRDE
ncbi:hypothetical protein FXW78_33900 [Rhodococcus opacus]|nr:hypothetical protein [Rhodococcus opacus]